MKHTRIKRKVKRVSRKHRLRNTRKYRHLLKEQYGGKLIRYLPSDGNLRAFSKKEVLSGPGGIIDIELANLASKGRNNMNGGKGWDFSFFGKKNSTTPSTPSTISTTPSTPSTNSTSSEESNAVVSKPQNTGFFSNISSKIPNYSSAPKQAKLEYSFSCSNTIEGKREGLMRIIQMLNGTTRTKMLLPMYAINVIVMNDISEELNAVIEKNKSYLEEQKNNIANKGKGINTITDKEKGIQNEFNEILKENLLEYTDNPTNIKLGDYVKQYQVITWDFKNAGAYANPGLGIQIIKNYLHL